MGIPNNIDGTWRDVQSAHVRINGVWRSTDFWTRIKGIYRMAYTGASELAMDLVGFRIQYQIDPTIRYPSLPHLTYNERLPVSANITGAVGDEMTLEEKSIIYQYRNTDVDQEGILVYRGTLYGVTYLGTLIDLGALESDPSQDGYRFDQNQPDARNQTEGVSIAIYGSILHESYGYFTSGWNQFLRDTSCIDVEPRMDFSVYRLTERMEGDSVLPLANRRKDYSPLIRIGIARNLTKADENMIGSFGVFDHTVSKIYLNGNTMPFSMEILPGTC